MKEFEPSELIDDDEPINIVCSALGTDCEVPNTSVQYCSKCRTEIVVAPTTVAMIKANPSAKFEFFCIRCAYSEMSEPGAEITELLYAPGARSELASTLGGDTNLEQINSQKAVEILRLLSGKDSDG